MRIELKGIRGTRGMEGEGYTASLHVDGKHIADVADYGDGGAAHFYSAKRRGCMEGGLSMVETEALLKPVRQFVAQIKATPEEMTEWEDWQKDMYPDGLHYAGHEGLEAYLAGLVDKAMEERRLQRLCKGRLVALLANGKTVYWKTPDTPEARERIAKKEQVKEWINDRFTGSR